MAPRSSSRPASDPSSPTSGPEWEPTPSSQPRPVGGIAFATPKEEEETTTPWSSGVEDGSPSLGAEPLDALQDAPSDDRRTSSKASSGSALSKRALRDAVRQGVLMAGSVAHQLLPRDQVEREVGLYLADEDDAEAIGDPLASIANRRGGLGAAANHEVTDAIAALIGLALYIAKQLARFTAARQLREQAAAAAPADAERPDDAGATGQAWPGAAGAQNG